MHQKADSQKDNSTRNHFLVISFIIFATGLAFILLSQQTSILVLGATGLILAHVAAFGGLFMFGGGWMATAVRNHFGKAHSKENSQ